MSLSNRPTGNSARRRRCWGSRSSTVRSRGSWVEETTPRACGHHINPLLRGNGPAIHCDGGAFSHLVLRSLGPGAPWTRPALTNALASFRDHWPVAANSLSNRSMVSPPCTRCFRHCIIFFRRGHRVRRRFSPPVPFPAAGAALRGAAIHDHHHQKLHPRRLVAGCALFALALGFWGPAWDWCGTSRAPRPWPTCKWTPGASKPTPTGWLSGGGWLDRLPEPAAVEDIRLPDTFDASYDEYLSLQKSQGFDLTQYAGKTVKRYTYQVSNYPGLQENIWASLLLYKKRGHRQGDLPNEGDGLSRPSCPRQNLNGYPNKDNAASHLSTVGGVCTAFSWRRAAAPAEAGRPAGPRPRRIGRPGALLPTRKSTTPGSLRFPP